MTPPRRRTYTHLEGARRRPSDYEVATRELLYPVRKGGLAVQGPIDDHLRRHQLGSTFAAIDWELFRDPEETTYARYTASRRIRDAHVDALLRGIDATGYDRTLDPTWLEALDGLLPQLRFVHHALQMHLANAATLAPSGTLAIALAFQAADAMRAVQAIARRCTQLRRTRADFAATSRRRWQEDPALQGLRRLLEELFLVQDAGEAIVAIGLTVKPRLDELFLVGLGDEARDRGDPLLGQLLFSLHEDALWQRACATRIASLAATVPSVHASVTSDLRRWSDRTRDALVPLSHTAALSYARITRSNETIDDWLATLVGAV